MRNLILLFLFCTALMTASQAYAVPESAEWGYEGGSKKTWLDDPALISKASQLNQKENAAAWGKYLIVIFAAGGVFAWWKKKNN